MAVKETVAGKLRITIDLVAKEGDDQSKVRKIVSPSFAQKVGEFAAHSLAAANDSDVAVKVEGTSVHVHDTEDGDICRKCARQAQRSEL